MNEEEKELYLRVYVAAIQGILASGFISERGFNSANYHPTTKYPASQHPDMVGQVASKQAHNAVAHLRALKDSFHK